MKKIVTVVLLTMMGFSVYAAGFRVALQSAKQTGMAHTGVGMNLGPESVFFNPGALVMAEKGGISFTGNGVFGNTTFNSPGTTYTAELADNVGTPFAFYGSHNFSDSFSAGLGVYTPYGNRVEWEDDWAGRAYSQSIDLKAIFFQPTVSYALSDNFGVGAGLIYATGSVELQRGIILPFDTGTEPDVLLATDKSATGLGFNAGMYLQASEALSFGVNYRSKIEVEAEQGDVTYQNLPTLSEDFNNSFTATKFDATLPLPAELAFGGAYAVNDRLDIAADFNLIFWDAYKSLDFYFNGNLGNRDGDVAKNDVSINPQNWENAWTFKLGGQYEATEKLDVRAGMYLDQTPIPDEHLSPITPDSDRFNTSLGLSYAAGENFSVDGSVLFVNGKERTVLPAQSELNGPGVPGFGQRYKVNAVVPGIGLNLSF